MKLNLKIGKQVSELYDYRDEPENLHKLANLLWSALLIALALIIIGAVVYGILELRAALAPLPTRPNAPSQTTGTQILNSAQLQSTLDAFVARTAQYESVKNHPPAAAEMLR